ncbi:phosphatase PAP2 family protein [Corynebacterium sp.]|uniref:phosphatase PAP2 family protein n=1 Tax=Corynebacterium sp. TaxID=1720 RepID=UPI0019CDF61F|nr:phosphatase PAP2 family protein [Corynebacterium sp.]HHU67095.1 phosphatase PAP2 family protein [Corynebacterium sp.]
MTSGTWAPDVIVRGLFLSPPPPLVDVAVVLAPVTGPTAVGLLALLLGVGWAVRARRRGPLLLPGAVLAANLISHLLKRLIGRERPPVEEWLIEVGNQALPSGHATGTAAFATALTLLLWARGGWWRVPVVASWGLSVLVGLSRLVLHVHWASDVLAGWVLGVGVALITRRVALKLISRKLP